MLTREFPGLPIRQISNPEQGIPKVEQGIPVVSRELLANPQDNRSGDDQCAGNLLAFPGVLGSRVFPEQVQTPGPDYPIVERHEALSNRLLSRPRNSKC